MQTKFVGHVCHFIFLIRLFRLDLHGTAWLALLGEVIASLSQGALEDLHQAVGVAVIMDWATLAGGPNKDQLSGYR